MLEKYHYLTFYHKCQKILDDGIVTDTEIDSLRKEEHGLRPVGEALDKTSKLVFAFGRFNPPTIGHAKLMKEVIIQARKNGANHIVYASASHDKLSNPLSQRTKVKFMKKMFPENKIKKAGGKQRTFMEILKFYNKIYGEIIMVAGSDRIHEFQALADKYNGTKEYEYKSVKVVSSGERDPDAVGAAGISASKMREMAKRGDDKSFKQGVSGLSDKLASQLFNAVRKGLGITGRNYPLIQNSFTNFLNNELREEYHQERIFNVGDTVEHLDGSGGMIVRRGTNYVSYESDGLIKKAWLYDLKPIEEMTAMRLVDLLPKKVKRQIYRVAHADKYKGALAMYHAFTKDKDMKARGVTKAKMKDIAADHFKLNRREFLRVLDRKTRYESVLETFEKEMGDTDEFFELNQVGVKTIESQEVGTEKYRKHTQMMTPGQPILSFKLANKVIERNDIDLFADEDEIIDKYKKRYGDDWKDELQKAVLRMKKEL
jgi:hypothetical protein